MDIFGSIDSRNRKFIFLKFFSIGKLFGSRKSHALMERNSHDYNKIICGEVWAPTTHKSQQEKHWTQNLLEKRNQWHEWIFVLLFWEKTTIENVVRFLWREEFRMQYIPIQPTNNK